MLLFDHLALSVPAISDAVDFYSREFPQTRVLYRDDSWALLEVGGLKIAFVLEEQHPPHMAFRTDSREELEQLAQESEAVVNVHRDGSESFYHEDTGNNVIEVIFYPDKSVN